MDSTIKCDKVEQLCWGRVIETFSGSVVDLIFDALELFPAQVTEASPFGDVSSNEADGVFHGSFLPAVVGVAEVGLDVH